MSNVFNVLNKKDKTIWSVNPHNTVLETLKIMAEKNVGAVIVLEEGKIAGIFSERDFARHSAKRNIHPEQVLIKEMMTSLIFSVSPNQTTEECMSLMTDKRIRHLPVIEDGRLVGLISIGDVVKQVIEDQKFSISQLERYVNGEVY